MGTKTGPSKRGRGEGEGTRAQIMGAALRKFSEKDFMGATTAEIADEAGVSEKTVFDLFGDKKTLYLEVRRSVRTAAMNDILPRLPLGGGAPAILRGLGREFAREVRSDRDRARVNVQATTAIDDPDIKKSVQEFHQQMHGLVVALLADGQEAGLVREDLEVEQFAWAYTMALHSAGYLSLMDNPPELGEESVLILIDRLVDLAEP